MKKLATKLTPAIKAWIKEEFGNEHYQDEKEYFYFHFPNQLDCKGFKEYHHTGSEVEKDYTLVSEQEFLNEFSTKKPKRGDLVLVRDEDSQAWREMIFLTEIVGAKYPYVVVGKSQEKAFKNNDPFTYCLYIQLKIPTLKKITIEEANEILKQFNKKI